MKITDIILTASSNLKRAKLRSFLTIIAIFIGSLTLTLTNGLGSGISSYIDRQVNSLGAKDVLVIQPKTKSATDDNGKPQKYEEGVQQAASGGPGGFVQPKLLESDLEKIRQVNGIVSATPTRTVQTIYIIGANNEKFQSSSSQYIDGTNLDLAAGSLISNTATENQVLIPLNYVEALGFKNNSEALGKTVTLAVKTARGEVREVTAVVKGVKQPSIISASGSTLNQPLLTELFDIQSEGLPQAKRDEFNAVIARFPSDYSESQIADLKKALDGKDYTAATIQDQIGIIKQVINAIIGVLNFFAAIALLAASFGIVNTLLMAVQERTKEIGLMKAMGMSSSRIFLLFSIEAAMLGFWGSLIGVGVAEILGRVANKIASDGFLKDLIGLTLLSFPWQSVVMIILLIMLIAFLAGTLPARRAAKQNPIDSLRYE